MKIVDVKPAIALGDAFRSIHIPAPLQLGHEIRVSHMRRRISMTVKAPAHAQRVLLPNMFHRVNATMALDTTDTTRDMRGVIEICVVREVVNTHPLNRSACFITMKKRLKQFAVWVNLRVAIHARLSRWNRSFRSDLDRVVAIATINAKFARMHRVTKWNWLHWLVPNINRIGTEPEGDHECDVERRGQACNHRCREK